MVERIFSNCTFINTKIRNRMVGETLSCIITLRDHFNKIDKLKY